MLYFNTRQPVEVYLHIHNCCDLTDTYQDYYGYIGLFIPVAALLMYSRQPHLQSRLTITVVYYRKLAGQYAALHFFPAVAMSE